MQFKQLEALVYVARHGTFKQAAEALHAESPDDDAITPESIQYRLRHLEQELGVSLYRKRQGSARVQFTREGQLFLGEARKAFERMSRWRGLFAETGDRPFTVAAPSALMANRLMGTILEFRHRHPATALRLLATSASEAESAILTGEAEIAFTVGRAHSREVVNVPWEQMGIAALAPAFHPLARAASVRLLDLAGESLIVLDPTNGPGRQVIDDAMKRVGLSRAIVALEVGTPDILASCVESGLGIGLMAHPPSGSVGRHLIPVPVVDLEDSIEATLLLRAGEPLSVRSADFLTLLEAKLLERAESMLEKRSTEEA